ncbi:hypothetical protein LJC31_05910 [Synergistaceae bacterium OttesenSCG-928-I11]|nr:hypothetical protein [Synergistaceae bacterium OttesenSCG-928-I11]
MYFSVERKVFEYLPNAVFGAVVVSGMDNAKPQPQIAALLAENIAMREAYFENAKIKEAPEILPYREAFKALEINPNKFMCSIEALLTRIAKKKGLPSINPAVDLGNALSLKYCLPIGAHDLDTVGEGLDVRFAQEGDTFLAFGSDEMELPAPDELIYVANHQVRTRRWTWRQSEIGKITENTANILYPIDGFEDINRDLVVKATEDFINLAQTCFGCNAQVGFIDKSNPGFGFSMKIKIT